MARRSRPNLPLSRVRTKRLSPFAAFCGKSGTLSARPCRLKGAQPLVSRRWEALMKTILSNQKNKINTQDIRLHVQFAFTREEKPAAS
jgi:hypothetical protein